jgi:hypothetical protein
MNLIGIINKLYILPDNKLTISVVLYVAIVQKNSKKRLKGWVLTSASTSLGSVSRNSVFIDHTVCPFRCSLRSNIRKVDMNIRSIYIYLFLIKWSIITFIIISYYLELLIGWLLSRDSTIKSWLTSSFLK